ncbi:UNVERIFIED_CONTAM: hypothetical protein NCL1_22276 [Trichonephila clavipes]
MRNYTLTYMNSTYVVIAQYHLSPLFILCWGSFNIEGISAAYALENQDGELQNGAVELVSPMVSENLH